MNAIVLSGIPTVAGIQRMTVVLATLAAAILCVLVSNPAALGCLIGGALMIANLYVLSLIGRAVLAIARDYGGATGVGIAAVPLKLFFIIGVVYLIVNSGRVNLPGFMVGILTQFAAIFIETWRISKRGGIAPPEGQRA